MKTALAAAALSIVLAPAGVALADDDTDCGKSPRDQWMSEDDIETRATELGYDVRSVDTEDGCYEVYAVDANGARLELYLNPVTGALVSSKDDD
jgi:hypothetical protein